MKHFLDLTTITSAEKYLLGLNDRTLVIYSPTSLGVIGVAPDKSMLISTHDIGKDIAKIEKHSTIRKIDAVVALGGGTAIDIAKYIAHLNNCDFICIPTMLSTNAFATNKAALIRDGKKHTFDARQADKVIVDTALIARAGTYNLYGLCDILSIHTALYDWKLADKAGVESIDHDIYIKAHNLLGKAIRLATESPEQEKLDILSLFTMIGEAGHITNLYGSGRPESGSEHIIAKELERRVEIPHGISIAVGITLMSYLQDNYSADVQSALRSTGIMADIADRYELREAIESSMNNLLPRDDRYTILDHKLPTNEGSKYLVGLLYEEILGVANEYSHR